MLKILSLWLFLHFLPEGFLSIYTDRRKKAINASAAPMAKAARENVIKRNKKKSCLLSGQLLCFVEFIQLIIRYRAIFCYFTVRAVNGVVACGKAE